MSPNVKEVKSMRMLEIVLGIAVLAVLCILIVIVISDNKKIRNDRMWLDSKFGQLLESNSSLQQRLLLANKTSAPSVYMASKDYSVHVASGYLSPANEEEDGSCDTFMISSVLTADPIAGSGTVTSFSLNSDAIDSAIWTSLESSNASNTLDVVFALQESRDETECGNGVDLLSSW